MANRNKARGTSFESLIATYLNEEWDRNIERLPLSGSSDRGDISNFRVGGRLVALECKAAKRTELSAWITEAEVEASNYGAVAGAVIHKRVRKGKAEDQFITFTVGSFLDVLHAAASPHPRD